MKKINKGIKRSKQLHLRLTISQKEELKNKAAGLGITMTEVIENIVTNIPIVDNKMKKEKFVAIHTLCKEINYIGKNINQITIALRQINANKKIEDGDFLMLVQELKKYNEKRNEISELLGKNLF